MNIASLVLGLLFIAAAALELWVAISLPRLLPVLRARAEAARPVPKGDTVGGGAGAPSAFDLMEANPHTLLVARVLLGALALYTIVFGWGFVTGG